MKNRALMNYLGLLGLVGFLSYTAAVVFSPLAYPGYDWMSRAVSDLSAANAPSLGLWSMLNALGVCGIVCVTLVCVYVQGKLNRTLRVGIGLFTVMQWISSVGFAMFPLTDAGYVEESPDMSAAVAAMFANVQDAGHMIVTVLVVLLSIVSLLLILLGGYRKKAYLSLAVWATVALALMMTGGVGVNLVPKELFGLVQRFSNFAAVGFNAVLGVYLYGGFSGFQDRSSIKTKTERGGEACLY